MYSPGKLAWNLNMSSEKKKSFSGEPAIRFRGGNCLFVWSAKSKLFNIWISFYVPSGKLK